MESSTEKAVKLTEYLVALPNSEKTVMLTIIMGFIFGVLGRSIIEKPVPLGLDSLLFVFYGGAWGVFLISVPALLSAVACVLVRRGIKARRVLFLAFVCANVYAIFYLISIGAFSIGYGSIVFLLIGYGFVFAIWFLIARIVFRFGLRMALFFSLIQLLFNLAFLTTSQILVIAHDPLALLIKFIVSSAVFLGAVYAVLWLVDAPIRRNFGVSGISALSMFIAQWIEQSRDLETVFEDVGEEVATSVGVVAFKVNGRVRHVFVIPAVHYGPFGNLGGSELPYIISKEIKQRRGADATVFHGTATHDFNPVSSKEAAKIVEAVERCIDRMDFRIARGYYTVGSHRTCKAECFVFNGKGIVALTRAPRTTEDIDATWGIAYRNLALSLGLSDAVVIDAHNADTGEITRVESGDPIGFEYMEAIKKALEKKQQEKTVKVGFFIGKPESFSNVIGKNGIRVIRLSIGDEEHALVVFDSNGITPSFRWGIVDTFRRRGVKCEVFTTDTHSVNVVRGVINPVGTHDCEEILGYILRNFENIETKEAEVDIQTECIAIRVFGVKHSTELIGTINSVVAIMRIAVPIIMIASVLFLLWLVTKIP
ncbi:MAG: DUF2070 family protein [Candidatus Micrarchaeia archaeon]